MNSKKAKNQEQDKEEYTNIEEKTNKETTTAEKKEERNKEWSTIHTPKEVLDLLKRIRGRAKENKANWKIILEALSFYESILSSPSKMMKQDKVEKVSWYITKLSQAYTLFTISPTPENYENLSKRLDEINKRLNVNTDSLKRLAEQYMNIKNEQKKANAKIELNQTYKLIIKEMILSTAETDEEEEDE